MPEESVINGVPCHLRSFVCKEGMMDVRSGSFPNQVALKRRSKLRYQAKLCSSCDGRGWVYSRVYAPCQDCQGRGFQEQQSHK